MSQQEEYLQIPYKYITWFATVFGMSGIGHAINNNYGVWVGLLVGIIICYLDYKKYKD